MTLETARTGLKFMPQMNREKAAAAVAVVTENR